MSATQLETKRLTVRAVLSLLGDPCTTNAATRSIRGVSVLSRTTDRVRDAVGSEAVTVLCWNDQVDAVRRTGIEPVSLGERAPSPQMQAVGAALRWSDGWRGGLLGATAFDRGFDAAATLRLCDADAVLLVDPDAALIEPQTLRDIIEHAQARPDLAFAFSPGAPGTGAMLLRRKTIEDLARDHRLPGSLLAYHPDRPTHDPIAKEVAVPVPTYVARSCARVTINSERQAVRLNQLNDVVDAREAVRRLDTSRTLDALPREVVVELTTRRATTPIWSILSKHSVDRPDLSIEAAEALFHELAKADDVRLTFAGVGDPLLHDRFFDMVRLAQHAGIHAIHVETDLLPPNPDDIDRLATSGVDIISFHLPAVGAQTYAALMGVDRMRDVLSNVKRLVMRRVGVPIVVPTFVKLDANVGEMETWYDQWLRALGTAVIVGPSDFSGRVEYRGTSDMCPGTRGPCRRLMSRMTVLSDGRVASCEEDVLGDQTCGNVAETVGQAWTQGLSMLRTLHGERRWDEATLCKSCRMWDRP
jgi:radical SAM protein with 4Fe4S-binding SPASM domain